MEQQNNQITGTRVLLNSLVESGVDTVFGYPGGQIMPLYDALYDYSDSIRHILVRHEQAAVHAAQGYARATGRTGVCFVTSGPGATNTVTGIADAMLDSTPLVVITGQVPTPMLGVDSFQEINIVGVTHPITKWNILVRKAEEIAPAIAKALYIASSGRPGPVLIDITKDAQNGLAEWNGFIPCPPIRSYNPHPMANSIKLAKAAKLIDKAKRPMIIFGQGVTLSGAEEAFKTFVHKSRIPAVATLLGLSALECSDPYYIGMIGMHGNYAPNITNHDCDLIVAIGMRFDDRVTCNTENFAPNAKIIHIDIDRAEINKIITADVGIVGDAKDVLESLNSLISDGDHSEWLAKLNDYNREERALVVDRHEGDGTGEIHLHHTVQAVDDAYKGENITVTDVGQHQMVAARYTSFCKPRSLITSGGLGTMGFGLPAAIGAKIGAPERDVVLFVGDGGIQMNIQELATIMQERVSVKIVLLNNNYLGMVRQWQQLFFNQRYSFTPMMNPNFKLIAEAHDVGYGYCDKREDLAEAVAQMQAAEGSYLLEVRVICNDNVLPMVAPGQSLVDIMLTDGTEKGFKCAGCKGRINEQKK
ncbi:MAG: biosynthetic-type acetolactate synthase large subunit [Rikenellaceae bacterium]